MRKAFALMLLAAWLSHAAAAPAAPASDPALERRVAKLSEQLRCVVCQNQTIADSQAELAVDLRQQVREKLADGMSDQQVLDFVVQRYGDFVLYRPRLMASTIVLWFAPALLLGAGMLALGLRVRAQRHRKAAAPTPDLARATALLNDGKDIP